MRQGDWKLVKANKEMEPMLVNLASDMGEPTDLSVKHPDKKAELQAMWERWDASMLPPRWEDRRWDDGNDKSDGKKKDKKNR